MENWVWVENKNESTLSIPLIDRGSDKTPSLYLDIAKLYHIIYLLAKSSQVIDISDWFAIVYK